jgi:AcrR family transcriptional regulator
MASVAGMRREPVQARAKVRLQRVLDAAESVFVELGYDGASTNAIAARAGTSIGSLYEFFPNKQAIAKALADRYEAELAALYEVAVVDLPGGRDEIVSHIVEALSAFYERHPGIGPLLRGAQGSEELRAAGAALQARFIEHLTRVIEMRRTGVDPARSRLVAGVVAEITRALMDQAASLPEAERDALVAELKVALVSYVAVAMPRT